jgi:hypothetical protein
VLQVQVQLQVQEQGQGQCLDSVSEWAPGTDNLLSHYYHWPLLLQRRLVALVPTQMVCLWSCILTLLNSRQKKKLEACGVLHCLTCRRQF